MPQLPGGVGNAAIAQAFQQALVVPADVPIQALSSWVFINFMVGPSGVIHAIKVVRGLNAACDAAAVAAVQKLPASWAAGSRANQRRSASPFRSCLGQRPQTITRRAYPSSP